MNEKNKLLDQIESLKAAFPEQFTCMITGGSYFTTAPDINLEKDIPRLSTSLYQEGDGYWGIRIEAIWGDFGRYPIAYLRTNTPLKQEYAFGEEFKAVQSLINDFPDVESVLICYMEQ